MRVYIDLRACNRHGQTFGTIGGAPSREIVCNVFCLIVGDHRSSFFSIDPPLLTVASAVPCGFSRAFAFKRGSAARCTDTGGWLAINFANRPRVKMFSIGEPTSL
jgi:hypothetical protein